MPRVAVTRLSSSLSQLKLLCQTTGQCEEQILSNKKKIKKNAMCLSALSSQLQLIQVTIHIINTNEIPGETIMLSSNVNKSPLLLLDDK